ncbi:matrilin-3a isoform X6 [Nelusetta ayraudi]|uniref:matrilin-3a isoform X6 n=1 Tax=Nelusetta ayraudi TaxID=303726 RepID=UPI003F724600
MVKCLLRSLLLYCSALLLPATHVRATYHLGAGDPQLIAAQSYAQTRNNGRPPMRTLNPAIHRGDYTYRGGYHYHYQPPRIPPPVVYRPVPLSPPVTYHRPPAPVPPYHHTFKGPHMQHIYKGLSPPVSYHPHYNHKGPFHYKWKDVCVRKPAPTVATTPVALVPTVPPPPPPEPTLRPTLPAATTVVLLNTTALPLVVTTEAPVETTAAVTLPVSTQSGLFTTVSAEVKAEVVVDPCKCEARLVFQKQTQATLQQLTAKLADVSGRIERLENMVGRA